MTPARKKATEVLKFFNTSKSQEAIILTHLFAIGPITSLEAVEQYKILRLSGRIFDLRKRGVPIETKRVYRNGTGYASYRLEGDED